MANGDCTVGTELRARVENNEKSIVRLEDKIDKIDAKVDVVDNKITSIQTTIKIAGVIAGILFGFVQPTISGAISLIIIGVLKIVLNV